MTRGSVSLALPTRLGGHYNPERAIRAAPRIFIGRLISSMLQRSINLP
jgi:hypothetical protein